MIVCKGLQGRVGRVKGGGHSRLLCTEDDRASPFDVAVEIRIEFKVPRTQPSFEYVLGRVITGNSAAEGGDYLGCLGR